MLLIADSGSTKTDWVLIDRNKNQTRYRTCGYNPFFIDSTSIYNSISKTLALQLNPNLVKTIFFYGAGCSTPDKTNIVKNALFRSFTHAQISVDHDLLGAARSLLGNKGGFAAIIGTGSNTCIYNGTQIEKNTDSLGYLLGDEGSGSYIGKMLIRDFMRNHLPAELQHSFMQAYHLNNEQIFARLYISPFPNLFLSGFCLFAHKYKEHEYIKRVVKASFTDFFTNQVCSYEGYEKFNFNCVGSVGSVFKEQLKEVAKSFHMEPGKFLPAPIDSLVSYHLNSDS